jgi:replicative DNA helicase
MLHSEESQDHGQMPTMEFIVGKHRDGPTGVANMYFNKAITRFEPA